MVEGERERGNKKIKEGKDRKERMTDSQFFQKTIDCITNIEARKFMGNVQSVT